MLFRSPEGHESPDSLPLWILGSYCLLVKESGIALYGLCFLWLLWIFLLREKSVRRSLLLVLGAGVGIGTSVALIAWTSGGLGQAVGVIRHNMGSVEHNEYARIFQSGRWTSYAEGLWMLSPVTTLLSVLGIGSVMLRRGLTRRNSHVDIAMALFFVAFVTMATLPRHLHNLRYISPVSGLFFLLAGVGGWWVVSTVGSALNERVRPVAGAVALAALLATAVADYRNFREIFLMHGAPDLTNRIIYTYSIYSAISPRP